MALPSGSMTFAGQPFVQPSPELMVKIGRWWDEHAPELWRHPGYALEGIHYLPVPDRPNQRKPRLNVLYWPTGASRWGTFHGLMTGTQVQAVWSALGTDSPTSGTFSMRTTQSRLVDQALVNATDEVTVPMYLLGARPVFTGSVRSARVQVSGTNLQVDAVATNVVYPDGYSPQDSDVGQTVTIASPDPPFTAGTYTITGVDGGGWLLSGAAGTAGSTGGVWSSSISTVTSDFSRRLYWVTLVDARYYWWTRPLSFSFASGDSWSTLLTSLTQAASGLTPTVPAVPSGYGSPNALRWDVVSRPLPLLLDAAASSVGFRLVYRRDGTARFVSSLTASQEALAQHNSAATRVVLGGYESSRAVAGNVPESVGVTFWDATTPDVVTKTLASLAIPAYGSMTGVANSIAFVGVDQPASVTSPTHAAAATQAATDYYGWALSLVDATYQGVCEFETTGMEDRIEWEYCPALTQLVDEESAKNPIDPLISSERVVTRVVPSDWHDRNLYGSAPPSVTPSVTSSDCSSLIGLIREGSCFTLTIAAGLGACSCVTTQTTTMTWDSDAEAMVSADYVYGCPPGVVTTFCPDGAPRKFRVVVAGFTGGSTGFNGTYTLTYTTGETWTGTTAGVDATLVQGLAGEWSLVLDDGSNAPEWTTIGLTNCCSDITLSLFDGDGTTTPPATLTAEPVTACGLGTPYTAVLDVCEDTCNGPQPRLRLVPATGSGSATIPLSRNGCSSGGGQFSTSNPIFCTGDVDTDCGDNFVTFTVACTCCSENLNPNYFGPGWYVLYPGQSVALTDVTGCLPDMICSGPWDTQAEADAAGCSVSIASCLCSPLVFPSRICLTAGVILNADRESGGCTGAPATSGIDQYGIDGMSFALTYSPTGVPGTIFAGSPMWGWRSDGIATKELGEGTIYVTYAYAVILCAEVYFAVGGEIRGGVHDGTTWAVAPQATGGCSGVNLGIFQPTPATIAGDTPCQTTYAAQIGCCLAQFDTISLGAFGADSLGSLPQAAYTLTTDWHASAGVECESAPGISFNCLEDGTCVDPGDGSGTFATEADCIAGCSTGPCCSPGLDDHPDLEVTLPANCPGGVAGDDSGIYTATWGGIDWTFVGGSSGDTYHITLVRDGDGNCVFAFNSDNASFSAKVSSCSPLSASGTCGDGSVTVTTA